MKSPTILLMVVLMTTATAIGLPQHGPSDLVEEPDMVDTYPGLQMSRTRAIACPAVDLHIITAHPDDGKLIGAILWELGAPSGTTASFYHGTAGPPNAVVAPSVIDAAWVATLVDCG